MAGGLRCSCRIKEGPRHGAVAGKWSHTSHGYYHNPTLGAEGAAGAALACWVVRVHHPAGRGGQRGAGRAALREGGARHAAGGLVGEHAVACVYACVEAGRGSMHGGSLAERNRTRGCIQRVPLRPVNP